MSNKIYYTDSNKKEINRGILLIIVISSILIGIALLTDHPRLPYTLTGMDIILIYLLKRGEYSFTISEQEIEKKWRYRRKTRTYYLNEIESLTLSISTSIWIPTQLRIAILELNDFKTVNFSMSKKSTEQIKWIKEMPQHVTEKWTVELIKAVQKTSSPWSDFE